MVAVKGAAGYFGNSYALIADGIESTTDVFSSLLLLFGLKYSSRPPDENHPYGHGRLEPLLTFMIVGFLIFSAILIAYKSILHIQEPHQVPEVFTLYVLGGIIIFKELSFQYVRRKSKLLGSSTLMAEAWHHRSDAITSLLAMIGISIAIFMGSGFENADDWAALLAAGFIIYNAYKLFRPALGEVMDEQLHQELEGKVRSVAESVPGVLETEKCRIRKVGMNFYIDLHVVVNRDITVYEGHDISHQVKKELFDNLENIGDVLIHIEPGFPRN